MLTLQHEVEAFERSAGALSEQVVRDSERGVFCMDLDELLRAVVAAVANLRQSVAAWQAGPKDPDRAEATSRQFHAIYVKLDRICDRCRTMNIAVQGWGYTVDGKAAFRKAWGEVRSVTQFNIDAVLQAAAQASRGELLTLAEVFGELHDSDDSAGV